MEDDPTISQMEHDLLKRNGYDVQLAYSGTEAKLLFEKETYDLVLLDLMLPGLSGENFLKEIRQKDATPVICISAKDDVHVLVEQIRNGADDYLVKPFHNEELLARMEAVLRRNGVNKLKQPKEYCFKDLILRPASFEVIVNDIPINLTKREFLILQLLMEKPNRVYTKNNIYEVVWNEVYVEDNAVNVHISNLRLKLARGNPKEKYIQTVWGIGFKMCTEE